MIAAALHGIAIADGVAVAVEGGTLHAIVIAQDREVVAVQVYVAQQVYVPLLAVVPDAAACLVHIPGIACQLCGIADFDVAVAVETVVLERLSVPQAVAVGGRVGTVLSERGVLGPIRDVLRFFLRLYRQCSQEASGHHQCRQPLPCQVLFHFFMLSFSFCETKSRLLSCPWHHRWRPQCRGWGHRCRHCHPM